MSTQFVMSLLYPALAVTAFTFCALMMLIYLTVRSTRLVLSICFYLFGQFLSFALLGLVTGIAPQFDINILRPYIVGVRFYMLVVLIWALVEAVYIVFIFPRREYRAAGQQVVGANPES